MKDLLDVVYCLYRFNRVCDEKWISAQIFFIRKKIYYIALYFFLPTKTDTSIIYFIRLFIGFF